MIGLILTAHGQFASGLKSALELITGGGENLFCLDFTVDNQSEYEDELKNLLDKVSDKYDDVAILTDLKGGTPFNKSVILKGDRNIEVLSGMNFQMAYEILFSEDSLENTVETALNSAKEGVDVFKMIEQDENLEDTDGI